MLACTSHSSTDNSHLTAVSHYHDIFTFPNDIKAAGGLMDAACRLELPRAQQAIFVYYCTFNPWVYYSNVGIALYLDWDHAWMRRYLFGSMDAIMKCVVL